MLEHGGNGKVSLNHSGDLGLKFIWGIIRGQEYERDTILKLVK
jgi:hypothetical protein